MKNYIYSLLMCMLAACQLTFAQNFETDVVIRKGPLESSSINLKNDNGFWHVSGPRSYENNNNLTFFWYNNASFFPRLTLQDNGNIGIGVTAADERLVINGGWKVILSDVVPTKNVARITSLGFSGITGAQNWALRGAYQYGYGINQNGDGGDLDLVKSLDGNTILATKSDGSSLGNVGIGTTDPKGYRLAVAGNFISESVTVKVQGQWPDYVFKHGYKLPPLPTVKAYINSNKHLSNMPTAAEVSKNGVDLGEMNRLLLRKVEELTLYLIEKDSQLEKEKRLNKKQEGKLRSFEKRLLKLEQKKHN